MIYIFVGKSQFALLLLLSFHILPLDILPLHLLEPFDLHAALLLDLLRQIRDNLILRLLCNSPFVPFLVQLFLQNLHTRVENLFNTANDLFTLVYRILCCLSPCGSLCLDATPLDVSCDLHEVSLNFLMLLLFIHLTLHLLANDLLEHALLF